MSTKLPPPPDGLLAGASLFLDFDGTLVDFADRPDAVRVAPELPGLLARLAERLDGRVAIVSGRAVAEILAFLPGAGIAIAGSHGLERRWPDGRQEQPPRPAALDPVLAEMRALAERRPGVLVEEKPFGAALHFRQAPAAEAECDALASALGRASGLTLQRGAMVRELRLAGADKGDAIRTLMAEPPMAGTRPVFLGDDLTDEHGFAAAAALGGAGVLVGSARATAARYRLEGVAAVQDWLAAQAAAARSHAVI